MKLPRQMISEQAQRPQFTPRHTATDTSAVSRVANEIVRGFFERKSVWAVPVAFSLIALSAFIVAADAPRLAPLCYCSGRF